MMHLIELWTGMESITLKRIDLELFSVHRKKNKKKQTNKVTLVLSHCRNWIGVYNRYWYMYMFYKQWHYYQIVTEGQRLFANAWVHGAPRTKLCIICIHIHVRWVCIIVTMTGRTDNNNFATLSDISFTAFYYLIYFCCCLFFVCFRIFIQISHTPQSGSLDCIRYTVFCSRFLHRDCRECLRLQSPFFFVVVVVGVEHICGAGNNKYDFLE